MTRTSWLGLVTAALLAAPFVAAAQPRQAGGLEIGDRSGRAIVGLSVGVGGFSDAGPTCGVCPSWSGSGLDGNLEVGALLTRRQALALEITTVTPAEDEEATFGAFLLEYSAWLTSRVSVFGGGGIGYLEVPAERKATYQASRPGLVLAGGLRAELIRTRRFSVDGGVRAERLQYLAAPATYLSMQLALRWYPTLPRW